MVLVSVAAASGEFVPCREEERPEVRDTSPGTAQGGGGGAGKWRTEAEPLLFDEDLKSDGGAEVGIQEYLGQRGELSRPVPAIGAMQSHRAAFLLHQPRDLRGRDLVLARRRRRGGHTGRNRPDSQDSIL